MSTIKCNASVGTSTCTSTDISLSTLTNQGEDNSVSLDKAVLLEGVHLVNTIKLTETEFDSYSDDAYTYHLESGAFLDSNHTDEDVSSYISMMLKTEHWEVV